MCTHKHYVTNPYTGQRLLVSCGKCDSCKQQKANRQRNRIRASIPDGFIGLFVGLTYNEDYIPYMLKSEVNDKNRYEFNIYRDNSVRRYKDKLIVKHRLTKLDTCSFIDSNSGEIHKENISFVPNLFKKGRGFHSEKMGVIYYKDIQDFYKRLRQNLSIKYGFEVPTIRTYTTTEYGETHFRPHAHALIITEKENADRVRTCILESWLFADRNELENSIEIARDAASYVASYVNSPVNFPKSLALLAPQKHSCSKNFGVELPCFRLSKILAYADKGFMCYSRAITINGIPTVLDVPVPKYVINRYFPQFKGLCRFTPDSLDIALRFPYLYFRYHKHEALTNYEKGYCFDTNESWSNYIRLSNAFRKYHNITGKSIYDYAIDYQRVWNCYKNTIYRMMFDDVTCSPFELYDNINEFWCGHVRNYSLEKLAIGKTNLPMDCNKFKSNVQITDYYAKEYQTRVKHKKVNNFIYSVPLCKNL